ncbi:MAPEG family protein [Sphingomonas sp. KR1UV-12]|uniref:MAPEG family protein n=1 Tax=Sphingomonas aurea TaxID=3063994 RepID=A0ABT9ENI3_9SPHN|nr:MAPEG family protein [Sphingomonas sp. KR1UV-12]MDP1028515.1 MAPEG family protein [Sphingomonas sp. KR1UV-12]
MILLHILWPVFAFVALIFTVWMTLLVQRLDHMKKTPPRREDFADGTAANRYFAPVALAGDNLRNLFETPVLFLVLVLLLMGTRQAGVAQVGLAWIFVILRCVHSWMHIHGRVRPRFRAFIASTAVLSAMWLGFFVDSIRAAAAYNAALGTLAQP